MSSTRCVSALLLVAVLTLALVDAEASEREKRQEEYVDTAYTRYQDNKCYKKQVSFVSSNS